MRMLYVLLLSLLLFYPAPIKHIEGVLMLDVIKMFSVDEGVKYAVYKDKYGNRTVGIGFNMDNSSARGIWIMSDIPESFTAVYTGSVQLSQSSAEKILKVCIKQATKDAKALFPDFKTYPYNVQLALINLSFNLGITKLSKFTTFISLVEQQKFKQAADDLTTTAWYDQVGDRADKVIALLNDDDTEYA